MSHLLLNVYLAFFIDLNEQPRSNGKPSGAEVSKYRNM